MIQVQTWLNTIDNSGARFVECIHTIGGFNRKYAYPGDFILVSVKQLRLVRKVKIGQIHLALITRARKSVSFKDGTYSNSQKNIVLIIFIIYFWVRKSTIPCEWWNSVHVCSKIRGSANIFCGWAWPEANSWCNTGLRRC